MKMRWVCLTIIAIAAVFVLSAKPHGSVGVIAQPNEPGTPLIISGQVFDPSGARPVAGVTIYAYQTDADGEYDRNLLREPRLRGWVTTDSQGRFELRTIRPGSYPGRRQPAHIHLEASGGGYPRQWLDAIEFADDPLVTERARSASKAKGRFGSIVTPRRGADGVLRATINIRLSETGN